MTKSILKSQITSTTARELVDAALSHANEKGWEIAAAVVDPAGYLVAFVRSDDVAPPIGQFALDKAYTAGTLRKATKAFGERMAAIKTSLSVPGSAFLI